MARMTTRAIPHRAQQNNSDTESHTNKEVIERARATLKEKQTNIEFFKAENQRPIGHRSAEPRNKRSLCDRTSSDSDRMADKRKKGGCAVSSEESRVVSSKNLLKSLRKIQSSVLESENNGMKKLVPYNRKRNIS
ncbi:hypothetical protein RRG08_005040 [Elysia crispata]|uniref:Uncharacterized protein n=1 Tax=Elysia crispata TaxID=231223 RepID=A0AAE0YZT5_9GAST|nr:hypothetical protein RRG08_005040 [Elysia crispata]